MRQSKNLPTKKSKTAPIEQQKKSKSNLPPVPYGPSIKEDIPLTPVAKSLAAKIKTSWKVFTLGLSVVILIIVAVGVHRNNIRLNAEAGWTALYETWAYLQYEKVDAEFKVKDLGPELSKVVQNALGTVNFLPAMAAQNLKTKDVLELEVMRIPNPMQEQILRRYHIQHLLDILPKAKGTESGPWIYYTLCKLYYLQQQPKEALTYYHQLATEHPQHRLVLKLQELQEQNTLQKETTWLESQKYVATANELNGTKVATFTTSKGKFTVLLWDQQFSDNTAHFTKLAEAGTFQGLNFYGINPNTTSVGCPMGNGKGGQEMSTPTQTGNLALEYGTVAFEPQTLHPNTIDSRLVIFKKYPWLGNRRYGWLGKVIEGMSVVESLTPEDVLLDVTISSK